MSAFTGLLRTAARPAAWSAHAAAPLAVRSNFARIAAQHRQLSQQARQKIDGVRSTLLLHCSAQAFRRWTRRSSRGRARPGRHPLTFDSRPQVVQKHPLVLFMKGTPSLPQCGFSRAVCQILEVQGVAEDKIVAFNCLEDQELREGIKEYRSVSPFRP